jgi:hypothetical protein
MDISIEHAIFSYFTQWLNAHSYLAWIISHPLPSLGLLLLAIFSLWGLFKAVGRGIEQIWLFLLTTPFKLLQPIFRLMWRSIQRGFGHTNSSGEQLESKLASHSPSERIERIIDRLQILSQEQENLLGELSTLVDSTHPKSKVRAKSST